jgi:hypothetical protein
VCQPRVEPHGDLGGQRPALRADHQLGQVVAGGQLVLNHPVGPPFATPAIIHTTNGFSQISPADERCSLGELTIRQDSTTQWPELSGELFTVHPIDSMERK